MHILLHCASFVKENVFAFAAAAANAEPVISEFGVKLIVFTAFFNAEVNKFEFNRGKTVTALMQVKVSITLLIVNNQRLHRAFVFNIGDATDRFFLHRFAHTVKNAERRFRAVTHAGQEFRAFFGTGSQRKGCN